MFRNCVRLMLLGLAAAVSTSTAQRANYTDLSGHYIEFDLITLSVQTQVEAILPIVSSLGNPDISKLAVAWSDNFRSAVKTSTMSVQGNADSLNGFLASAAKVSPSFVTDVSAALSKSAMDYFKFHSFMPAATWDVVEYGIVRSSTPFNVTRLDLVKTYMKEEVDTTDIDDLQEVMDTYLRVEETKNPGFKAAVLKELNTAYRTVWTNNPTRAPTAAPSTSTPSVTSVSPTTKPTQASSSAGSSAGATTSPTTADPTLYIGEPMPEDENATPLPTSVPTPAPTTKKSGATTTASSVVVSAVMLAAVSALL